MVTNEKHEFAVFVEHISAALASKNVGDRLILESESLYHRIVHVLRLGIGESLIVFDEKNNAHIRLSTLASKKKIEGLITHKMINPFLAPKITVILPILKREAFEEAIYSCVELGATEIQLVTTQKTQRSLSSKKDMQRINNIMVAAAEQSKQFALPLVHEPIGFDESLTQYCTDKAITVCCDLAGKPFASTLTTLLSDQPSHVIIIVGPEGDFSLSERDLLREHSVLLTLLTPTVLRTQQALVLALGSIRAVLTASL